MFAIARTYYSLRYGTQSPETMARLIAKAGYEIAVLTDINNTTAWVDFYKACKEEKILMKIGIEVRRGAEWLYTLIAENREGFRAINEMLSECHLLEQDYPDYAPPMEYVIVVYPLRRSDELLFRGNEYIGIRQEDLSFAEKISEGRLISRFIMFPIVSFCAEKDFEVHQHLRAIEFNTMLNHLQDEQIGSREEQLTSREQILKRYKASRHSRTMLQNAEKISNTSTLDFDLGKSRNKRSYTGSEKDDRHLLQKLAFDGLIKRYGNNNIEAAERLSKELDMIERLHFSSYFLIAWDIIRYAMGRGFYHVGRGSGANSITAYCLFITNVDPIELDLYFERFINPKRSSPPDFDIDFSWKDREEVQDYIFKRYGSKHTALLGMMQTFRDKSVYRELGKVYGLPKFEIDEMVEGRKQLKGEDSILRKIREIAISIKDFPNLRSIHAGGVLISEKPLTYYTTLDRPPKGMATVQWDMYVAEDLGFEKFDILSQRGIGHICDSVNIIRINKGANIDVFNIEQFKKDLKCQELLKKGETLGCFYIESPAMRSLLQKLQCNNYLQLVAASSIIRPGVSKSGMMREYIQRHASPEKVQYLHPILQELLAETYGVMVYQEDVIKVVHYYAGLDLTDADVLRRAMSGKYRSKEEMQRIVERFFESAKKMGRPEDVSKELWRQIESFSGYSFSKAHSASFAAESYQSLFIKAYFPLEFIVAVINNFGGYYKSWVYFNEAKRCGAQLRLPCINRSDYLTKLAGKDIFPGFVHLKGLEYDFAISLLKERQQHGSFKDLADFVRRTGSSREQTTLLIRSGAFSFTGKTKPELLWEIYGRQQERNQFLQQRLGIDGLEDSYELPVLKSSKIEDAYDEIELFEFPLSLSWFDLLKTNYRGDVMAQQLNNFKGKNIRMLGVLVTLKPVRTSKNEKMFFSTFLDAEGHLFDGVNFPISLRHYPFKGPGVYLLRGIVEEEFGFHYLKIDKMALMGLLEDPRAK